MREIRWLLVVSVLLSLHYNVEGGILGDALGALHSIASNFFMNAGQNPGLEIWRIIDGKPVPVPQADFGKFDPSDAYVVLQTGADMAHNVRYWLGDQAAPAEIDAASTFANDLVTTLGEDIVPARVVQGAEDVVFADYFPTGLSYDPVPYVAGPPGPPPCATCGPAPPPPCDTCPAPPAGPSIELNFKKELPSPKISINKEKNFGGDDDDDDCDDCGCNSCGCNNCGCDCDDDDSLLDINFDFSFSKSLFKVKGKLDPLAVFSERKASDLNDGDSYVLDLTKKTIKVLLGKNSSPAEKSKAKELATWLNDHKHNGEAEVKTIDEHSSEDDVSTLLRNLGGNKKSEIASAESGGDDKDFENHFDDPVLLYRVKNSSGTLKTEKIDQKPLSRKELDSHDAFILDTVTSGIFTWFGDKADAEEKREALRKAKRFKKNYPKWVPIEKVKDGHESFLFKQYFHDWKKA